MSGEGAGHAGEKMDVSIRQQEGELLRTTGPTKKLWLGIGTTSTLLVLITPLRGRLAGIN